MDNIRLWNLEKNTSSVAFKFNEGEDWHLCVIDERTVACAEQDLSSGGLHKIYIFNTDSEKFTLSSTILLKVGDEITDMCYVKTTDGTACLLLSYPWLRVVKCVEIVGGKVRWQVYKQQIGGLFFPFSLCTDGSTVFVADFISRLRLLSVEDGAVATFVNLHPFGIEYPTCVRLQGEHLYVGHVNEKGNTYCVSKFAKPSIQDSD